MKRLVIGKGGLGAEKGTKGRRGVILPCLICGSSFAKYFDLRHR